MRLAQAKQLAAGVRAHYQRLDAQAAAAIADHATTHGPPSCKKGCDACCKIMVLTTPAEAVVIALGLFKKPDWRALLPALRVAAQGMASGVTEGEFARARTPCVFLRDNQCSVYDDRGAACRLYYVFSPAENCDADETRPVKSLNTIAMQGEVITASTEAFSDLGYAFAPLPLMVLHAMRWISQKPAEQAEIDAALSGLRDPLDWFNQKMLEHAAAVESGEWTVGR